MIESTPIRLSKKSPFTSEECFRMIVPNFHWNQINPGMDTLLFEAQEIHMVGVLERVP